MHPLNPPWGFAAAWTEHVSQVGLGWGFLVSELGGSTAYGMVALKG